MAISGGEAYLYTPFEIYLTQTGGLQNGSITTEPVGRICTVQYIIVSAKQNAGGSTATLACFKRSSGGVDTNLLMVTTATVGSLAPSNDAVGVWGGSTVLLADPANATLGATDSLKITTAVATTDLKVVFVCSPTADLGVGDKTFGVALA
tara:strand:+ start:418 stop:867 length:450 start_codon:yes stop_codon:yes gene_type:complete